MSDETDVLEGVDAATFQASLANAQKLNEAGPKDPRLEAEVEAALHADVARMQHFAAANPGHDLVNANQHLRLTDAQSRSPLAAAVAAPTIEQWHCGGSVNVAGMVMWSLGVTVMFAPPLGFMMGAAGGPDLAASAFTSGVFGSFVVDPASIRDQMTPTDAGPVLGTVYKGQCNFQLAALSTGAGAVRLSFYSLKGTYWGLIGGVAGGLGGISLSGTGDMVWTG
jgi:hypothetical protein